MIARITSGNFIKGAVAYNEAKVSEGEASAIDMRNFDGDVADSAEAVAKMMMQCTKATSNNNSKVVIKKPVFSCSLNLNQIDLDRLKALREERGEEAENDFYRDLAARYMKGMGYGSQPYIVYKHEDIERTHIHIISIRVDRNRRKINDSNEKLRSERVRKEIAQALGLSDEGERKTMELSDEEAGKLSKKRSDYIAKSGSAIEQLSRLDAGDASTLNKLKHKISNILKFVDENYKPKNMNEYNKILSQFNIRCNRIDTLDKEGRRINGCQFGAVDPSGNFVTHLIRGGQINEKFTLPKLETKFALASGMRDDIRKEDSFSRKYITTQLDSILKSPRKIDMDYLQSTLRVRGVEVNLVTDNEEKVVGVNFIDNLNGKVFSGSALGRAYTYGNLSASIESHNRRLDSGSLEKETFTRAVKLLTSLYNDTRKSNYYLESDLIKDLPERKESMTARLMDDMLLTEAQASKCFDTFARYKQASLPSIEVKENGYQQTQIITALKFATMMREGDQGRVDLMHRMGVSVTSRAGVIIYSSERKPDVWLSYSQASDIDGSLKDGREPVTEAVTPKSDLIPLGKTEKSFVKEISEGGDATKVKGEWLHMLDLLDGKTRERSISDDIVRRFASAVKTIRNDALRTSGEIESVFIKNMERVRGDMVPAAAQAMGVSEETAGAIFDRYKRYQMDTILPDVEKREEKAVLSRIELSLRFASRIEEPSRRTEFLKRMEINVGGRGDELHFSYDRKPDFSVPSSKAFSSLTEKTGFRIPPLEATPSDWSVQPFTKKERDFVKDYLSGARAMDGRHSAALSFLGQSEQDKAKAVGVATRTASILSSISTRTADEMVRSLLYRGFVIHPVREGETTAYKVSRYNNRSVEAMATLPKELSDKLDKSNFMEVYPKMKRQLLDRGLYGTPKLYTVMSITRAQDYRDERLLRSTIEEVAKVNRLLAEKMEEAARPGKDGSVDYGRIARLVARYAGEKDIKLPPPTVDEPIDSTEKQMEKILMELTRGNSLAVAVRLLKDENINEIGKNNVNLGNK
ncbi:MAG: relaxase/mobilization nuclease domain-containing protein [Prevotella sp.]|nr:relaxase/mobilization nuclease domain-containing protein [Prevotella sp.]